MLLLVQGLTPLANNYRPFGTERQKHIQNLDELSNMETIGLLLAVPVVFLASLVYTGIIFVVYRR